MPRIQQGIVDNRPLCKVFVVDVSRNLEEENWKLRNFQNDQFKNKKSLINIEHQERQECGQLIYDEDIVRVSKGE